MIVGALNIVEKHAVFIIMLVRENLLIISTMVAERTTLKSGEEGSERCTRIKIYWNVRASSDEFEK
ncbi:hypothetical protein BKP57_05940 [Virgibacillus sp. 6R]|nr:hypothetical protein BKP57_05940 [Virgibacillus sp. 6R]